MKYVYLDIFSCKQNSFIVDKRILCGKKMTNIRFFPTAKQYSAGGGSSQNNTLLILAWWWWCSALSCNCTLTQWKHFHQCVCVYAYVHTNTVCVCVKEMTGFSLQPSNTQLGVHAHNASSFAAGHVQFTVWGRVALFWLKQVSSLFRTWSKPWGFWILLSSLDGSACDFLNSNLHFPKVGTSSTFLNFMKCYCK